MKNIDLKQTPVAVLGFGRSGRAATDFLLAKGADVSVYVPQPLPPCDAERYASRGVRFCTGELPPRFSEPLLVRSPVIRPDVPSIVASLECGAMLTDEIDLFLSHTPARVIGVTGSDGKTTTSALIARLLSAAGESVFLGGNNGTPLLPRVGEMTSDTYAVLELSSFQLMTKECATDVAVITNVSPNHLDWHRDMAEYVAAKRRILKGARRAVMRADLADVIGIDDSLPPILFFGGERPARARAIDGAIRREGRSIIVCDGAGEHVYPILDALRLPGEHNVENLMAALGAVYDRTEPLVARSALWDFYGVAHRLQYVDSVSGVDFYNSSIDTSPTRTAAALKALGRRPLVIVGGRGKGVSLLPLAQALCAHAKAVFAYGDTREEIAAAIGDRLPVSRHHRFRDAFWAAVAAADRGDTVLLSPGCTAFGEFVDFEQRGEVFCRLVKELALQRKEEKIGTQTFDPDSGGHDEHHGL